ncbi:hypothetical protein C2G38_1513929 [Gigaspora rosea]|uniref:Uncharacterized protein n=1 Tax=Gigaspora rosea TaxID=44941 RepID=A0A397W2R0_9GLOM|nr:hypothetical protein C2G38_1513929 [Gigaspora rosea]
MRIFQEIFNFETEKEVSLTFPDWQKEIDFLSFTDNGNIVMVNAKYYRAYVFASKDNVSWVCISMIELKYFKQIYITLKGKVVIFNDTIYEITMWDIEKLSVITRVLIDWNYTSVSVEISDDEELLIVCAKNEESKETRVYTFYIETGMNLAFYKFHLIASRKGESLLYVSGREYYLMDPYDLKNPIDAREFFEIIEEEQIQEPYLIRSDKIIYIIDGKLSIKELVPDNSDDWVEYLRKALNDTNSITASRTIDILTEIINSKRYNPDKKNFEGKFLQWNLESDDNSVKLAVIYYNYHKRRWNNDKKKQLDILPSFYSNRNDFIVQNFILHCEILENDDFITITRIGIFIWTYKLSEIKMHCYWTNCNDRLEDFLFEKEKLKIVTEEWISGRILPVSNVEIICKNLDVKFGGKEFFEEFIKNKIDEEYYLALYGRFFMKVFISLKNDKLIRYLCQSCMDKCVQDDNHLISKISLLSIIFENFNEISVIHPASIANTLSKIAFVVPTTVTSPKSTSLHLSSYGKYCYLSKTSCLDILTSIFWNRWISFQKWFQNRFPKFQDRYLLRNLTVKHVIEFINLGHNTTVLAIPLPNFVSYPKDYNFWIDLLLPSHNSFTYSNNLEVITEEFYRNLNGEALLEFKWNTYGKKILFSNLDNLYYFLFKFYNCCDILR